MGSTFQWLDFSEHERRKALDVIDMFREHESRDELGIGTIRDALSDVLFPGISTIQTRARYFLFIPWLYLALESKMGAEPDIERRARREELRLIDALAGSNDTDGVIGIEARERLKRLPSNVYWQGLSTWGLRIRVVSQSDYHRFFSTFASARRHSERSGEDRDEAGSARGIWHEGLPSAPIRFPDNASFALTREEAGYLRERLLARQPGRLLTWLVDRTAVPTACAYPWLHPQIGNFTSQNRDQLEHARRFSLVMHGAALVYNLMLCELLGAEEAVGRYRSDLEAWSDEVAAEQAALATWDRPAFWALLRAENPRVSPVTQAFVTTWVELATGAAAPKALANRPDARALIEHRERRLKGLQSRFVSQRSRELWGGESGAYRLGYRWTQTQRIVNDIVTGLHGA